MGRRCIRAESLPAESDHQAILNLSIPDAKALSVNDFIARSKLGAKLDLACKSKADGEKGEKKNEGLTLGEITSKYKEKFGRTARSYVIFLFKGAQGLNRFSSDIVKGLGSFDLDVMHVDPLDQAAYCFKQFFTSLRLRGFFNADEESIYTEESLSFLDTIRQTHVGIQQPKLLIAVVIDFVSGQESLKSRLHLQRIFRLSCLCLDEPRLSFSSVKFGSHHTDDPLSPMFDVVAPIQSHLSFITDELEVFRSDSALSRFLLLEQSFGNAGLSDVYSPWDSIDRFNRAEIRKTLSPSEAQDETPSKASNTDNNTGLQSFPVPKPGKRRSHLLSGEKLADSASRLVAGCSRD